MEEFAIIEKLGGREAVFEKLRARGDKRTTVHALRMWVRRGSMPGDAMRRLMAIAEAEGVAYAVEDFRIVGDAGLRVREAFADYRLGPGPAAAAGPGKLVIEQPDAETLAVLRRRAQASGRSLEAEIGAVLIEAAGSARRDLAEWAARLRQGLAGVHAGDVTGDIRADRQR